MDYRQSKHEFVELQERQPLTVQGLHTPDAR
jgi:hypothetical protein